jgi:hypothetical protein
MRIVVLLLLAMLSSCATQTTAPNAKAPTKTYAALPPCVGDEFSQWTNCLGTATWPNGERYIGEWKDGKQHGQGTFTFPDGPKYVGEWKNNNPDGQGTLTFPGGQKFVGEWKDGKAVRKK